MANNFSHQTNTGKTVNVVGDRAVVQIFNEPAALVEDIQPDVGRLFASLKKRYQNLYEQKLDGRVEITLKVVKDWDGRRSRIVKERFGGDASVGEAVEVIGDAFEREGGLLIVGRAGAGKTVLLLKLALSLLEKTVVAKDEPFPVIFNLSSWSPAYEKFEEWLVEMLYSGNGLSRDFAETLLRRKQIVFLLDGLDELARNEDEETALGKRAACLDSLNDYLREGRKAVICCRRDEFVQMHEATKQDAPVSARVELLDLSEAEILSALERARTDSRNFKSATNLLKAVETNRVLLDVLRTPFYFITALEVFDKYLLNENAFPSDEAGIKQYLLGRFVERKLFHTPNRYKFEAEKTKRWLKGLAKGFEATQAVSFELAYLQPGPLRRAWGYRLLEGLAVGLGVYLCFDWFYGLAFGLYSGMHKYSYIQTEDIQRVKPANLRAGRKVKRGLIHGFVIGSVMCLLFNIRDFSVGGLAAGVALGLYVGVRQTVREVSYFVKVDTPYQRLKAGLVEKVLTTAFVCLAMNALSYYVNYNGLGWDDLPALLPSFVGGAIIGLSSTPLFRHFLLRLCRYLEGVMPLRYATFLDYAAEARILEKDGGHWHFRHRHLQQYFAGLAYGRKFS